MRDPVLLKNLRIYMEYLSSPTLRKKTPLINYLRRNLIQDISRFLAPLKPRPRDYTFKEWVKLKKGHLDISKSVRKDLFRLWVIDKSTEALGPDENPFGRCLDEYIWLKVRIKIGGMITGEDEEKMELGNEDYNPPIVHTETFEVTKYKFDNRCSFICVSGENNETLSLGRKNGSRFRKMIIEEMEEVLRNNGEDSDNKRYYPIWEVIQRGNGHVSVSTDTNGVIKVLPPKNTEEILARERERKARTTLLMTLPEDHLAKFHKMTDAKEMWEAIKSRFGGNDESKKMQKYILKQQFKGFSVSNSEGLHKVYDRFQSLLSQLEIHGAGVSTEDANQKFLISLPFAWSQVSLIMRTKPRVDTLSFDDLYNNLKVFKSDVKGSIASSSSMQNVAFVSENTRSTNEFSTAYGASSSSSHKPQREGSSLYADDLIFSFFANQSSGLQLDHEDLEQLDEFDLEEMDLKWQVAMISMRINKFYKKIGRRLHFDAKEPVGFNKSKFECYNCHKTGHFAKECRSKGNQDSRRRDALNSRYKAKDNGSRPGKQEETKALVTLDGDGVDWTSHSEDEQDNYALMAFSNSGSDTKAYTQALKKVEAQLVAYQQNQLWYEEKIKFMKIDLDDKTDVLTYHKKLLAEAEKEKEELKTKVEKWHNSSKNLNILLNSQMSARDKAELGYGNQMNNGILSYENEVFGDRENRPVNDRYAEGMHAQSKPSESDTRSSDFDSCESNSSEETLESMPELVVNEPKVVCQPKVWSDAPIIEEYGSESDDEHESLHTKEQETPSFAFVNTDKHIKTPRQTIKQKNTCSKSPKPDKKDCSCLMSKKLGLGYRFTTKACFVCGSLSHLIRDCDFHEKMMAKQVELNKQKDKGNVQRENKPVWNNVQRVNHKNQFVPNAILTRTGKIQVNTARASSTNNVNNVRASSTKNVSTARHTFNSQAVLTNAARKINTVKPIDYPQRALKNKGIIDSGCSRHMTGNKAYLAEYQDYNGGHVAFGGSKGYITGKEEQGLFTDTECLVLSPDFKLLDENQILLRVPRQNNMYSFNLENIAPSGGLACLIAKAAVDESNKWHWRLGHVNFKNLNKLVKGNLVRGLPFKIFQNDHTCVACQKGKC
ncbi:ribonuclease H-like domain-containing protein [Tanacetum coccineum]